MFSCVLRIEAIGRANNAKLKLYRGIVRESLGDAAAASVFGNAPSSGWCAKILGTCRRFGLKREFVTPMVDHVGSSSSGNRGVSMVFLLEEGCMYEIFEKVSWRSSRRYFGKVQHGTLLEVTREKMLFELGEHSV